MRDLRQLTLDLCFKEDFTFDNFYSAGNQEVFSVLNNMDALPITKFIYLHGAKSSGRSHLLMALCNKFKDRDLRAIYLPFFDLRQHSQEMLENMDSMDLVCVDDLDAILGSYEWEENFFYFFNKIIESKAKLVISAIAAPAALEFSLADLKSRMMSGIIFKINNLSDDQKIKALQLRAQFFGLSLSEAMALFLINHCNRDNAFLFSVLKKLDNASLQEKRKLTIPFVKKVLQQSI